MARSAFWETALLAPPLVQTLPTNALLPTKREVELETAPPFAQKLLKTWRENMLLPNITATLLPMVEVQEFVMEAWLVLLAAKEALQILADEENLRQTLLRMALVPIMLNIADPLTVFLVRCRRTLLHRLFAARLFT